MLGYIRTRLKRRWMERDPVAYARSIGVRVGEHCVLYGVDEWTFGTEPYLVRLGNHVEMTGGVRFITHDGGVWVFREKEPELEAFGPITVGDNVFLGMNVIILPGKTIGSNCVIGAGAVVTKDVPDGMVYAGIPARPVCTVEEYRANLRNAMFIRHLPDEEKRAALCRAFQGFLHPDDGSLQPGERASTPGGGAPQTGDAASRPGAESQIG